jgi:hypothetical protein
MDCYNTHYIMQISIFVLVTIINYSQVAIILLISMEVNKRVVDSSPLAQCCEVELVHDN